MKLHPATLTAPFHGYPTGSAFLVGWDAGRCLLFANTECGPHYVAQVPLKPETDTRTLFVLS